MTTDNQNYSRRTYVCWPIKFGGFRATWPFGKILINQDFIEVKATFVKGFRMRKQEIISIEFTNKLSDNLFHIFFLGKDCLCKININNDYPKWIAFLFNQKDIEKLKQFNYIQK